MANITETKVTAQCVEVTLEDGASFSFSFNDRYVYIHGSGLKPGKHGNYMNVGNIDARNLDREEGMGVLPANNTAYIGYKPRSDR